MGGIMKIRSYPIDEEKIRQLKDIDNGKRCFLMATGPSLKKINDKCLKKLENEIVIGLHDSFKIREYSDINFKYYAMTDLRTWNNHCRDILNLETNLFVEGEVAESYLANKRRYDRFKNDKCEIYVTKCIGRTRESEPNVLIPMDEPYIWKGQDLSKGTYSGVQSFLQIPLPISYYIGCKEIYILGLDFDPATTGYHFFLEEKAEPEAPMRSKTYWRCIEKEYEAIKVAFEKDGRKVYNATDGGKMEVFERVNLEDIL